MTAIVTVILSFLLTGLVGNSLLQRWQHRNWLSQQRFSLEDKEYQALSGLFQDLVKYSSQRHYRMRRLLRALSSSDEEGIKAKTADYDEALTEWNDIFNSLCVRLTLLAGHQYPPQHAAVYF